MLQNKEMEADGIINVPEKATIFLLLLVLVSLPTRSRGSLINANDSAPMASSRLCILFFFLLSSVLFISHPARCADEEDNLLQSINSYRASLNLTALTKNKNAECLAEEIADQFKNQPCTNSTGSNTVPGTEPQFSNLPNLLEKCHLNVSNTRDGQIMPACVPNLDPNLVLTNFTQTQYSGNLNDTAYTGAGVGSDGNWIVLILTTSTPEGSYVTYNAGSLSTKIGLLSQLLLFLMASLSPLLL